MGVVIKLVRMDCGGSEGELGHSILNTLASPMATYPLTVPLAPSALPTTPATSPTAELSRVFQ